MMDPTFANAVAALENAGLMLVPSVPVAEAIAVASAAKAFLALVEEFIASQTPSDADLMRAALAAADAEAALKFRNKP